MKRTCVLYLLVECINTRLEPTGIGLALTNAGALCFTSLQALPEATTRLSQQGPGVKDSLAASFHL